MAFSTSSILGTDLNNSSSTQLFTLNQPVLGNDASEWQYIKATGTLTTGMLVTIAAAGTAQAATTSNLMLPVDGFNLGFTQFQLLQGEFGFVAKRGQNMYVQCSGTVAGGAAIYLASTVGVISSTTLSATLAGIMITTSASTAGLSVMGRATLTYPRVASTVAVPLG